ncbi:MAG TPA: S1 family peptidase [Xanthomonadaceae bacterium]|nr:S1 family peptidase [Xanthomonadaceae bacterium]
MKRVPLVTRRALPPLALAVALSLAAAPALAANDVAPALRSAMQRDLGLTAAQLSQYLNVERQANRQQKTLAGQQGRHFAGSWIERKGNGDFQLVVATTSIAPQKGPAGVEIRQVRHSLADLEAAKAQLDAPLARGAKVPKGVYGWHVDLQSNTVVVSIGKGGQQAGVDFVARSGADARTVRFQVEDEQPTLRSTLKGGLGYLRNPGDGYLYACSIGFNVTQGSTPGYVTAGHCGDTSEPVYLEGASGTGPQWSLGPKFGNFAGSSFPQPGGTGPDYAWVKVDAGNTLQPTVYGWGKGDVTVTGHAEAAIGTAICRSGRTTGWHCGTIQAKNVTVNYSSGETVLNLTQTTACSEGGDSGGSYITGTGQAQGVLSGGSGSCKGDKNTTFGTNASAHKGKPGGGGGGGGSKPSKATTFFTPVNPILQAYNLTLVTGN